MSGIHGYGSFADLIGLGSDRSESEFLSFGSSERSDGRVDINGLGSAFHSIFCTLRSTMGVWRLEPYTYWILHKYPILPFFTFILQKVCL